MCNNTLPYLTLKWSEYVKALRPGGPALIELVFCSDSTQSVSGTRYWSGAQWASRRLLNMFSEGDPTTSAGSPFQSLPHEWRKAGTFRSLNWWPLVQVSIARVNKLLGSNWAVNNVWGIVCRKVLAQGNIILKDVDSIILHLKLFNYCFSTPTSIQSIRLAWLRVISCDATWYLSSASRALSHR